MPILFTTLIHTMGKGLNEKMVASHLDCGGTQQNEGQKQNKTK